jgi:hypothetical protein
VALKRAKDRKASIPFSHSFFSPFFPASRRDSSRGGQPWRIRPIDLEIAFQGPMLS